MRLERGWGALAPPQYTRTAVVQCRATSAQRTCSDARKHTGPRYQSNSGDDAARAAALRGGGGAGMGGMRRGWVVVPVTQRQAWDTHHIV
jgi:hypothetical protein